MPLVYRDVIRRSFLRASNPTLAVRAPEQPAVNPHHEIAAQAQQVETRTLDVVFAEGRGREPEGFHFVLRIRGQTPAPGANLEIGTTGRDWHLEVLCFA